MVLHFMDLISKKLKMFWKILEDDRQCPLKGVTEYFKYYGDFLHKQFEFGLTNRFNGLIQLNDNCTVIDR
jgi:hypothetical protein